MTNQYTCYSCEIELTPENKSEEHIIPQAIGGVLRSKNLLCRTCNSKFGETIDSALSKALESFTALLAVRRERKAELPELKNLKAGNGKMYHLKDGRIPVPAKEPPSLEVNGNLASFSARNEKELRQLISSLKKKKYPMLDDSDLKSRIRGSNEYLKSPLTISLNAGGEPFLQAIAKTAVNFFLYRGGDRSQVRPILDFIKGSSPNDYLVHFFQAPGITQWSPGEVSHLLYLKGDAKNRLLYGYVVLFSSFAYIVNINGDYSGPDAEDFYCFDVVAHSEVQRDFSMDYPGKVGFRARVNAGSPDWEKTIIRSVTENMNRVIGIANAVQTERSLQEITENAFKEVLGKYPVGTPISEAIMKEISRVVSTKAAPFIVNLNRQRKG